MGTQRKAYCGILFRRSIYNNILITFMLVLLPLFILYAVIYNWALITIRNNISETKLTQMKYHLDTLENEIRRIKWLQYDCLGDENLKQLATIPESLDPYDYTKAIMRLQQRLIAIANSSEYIRNVKAFIPRIVRTVNTERSGFESYIDPEELTAMNTRADPSKALIIYWKNRLFMSVTYPTLTEGLGKEDSVRLPYYTIAVELSSDAIARGLEQFNNTEQGGTLLVSSREKFVAADAHNQGFSMPTDVSLQYAVAPSNNGSGTVYARNEGYFVYFTRSEYLDTILISHVPETEVSRNFRGYYVWFGVFTVMAIILVTLYSAYTRTIIQKPLGEMVKSFGLMESGDLSIAISHSRDDEFKYLYISFNEMVRKLKTLIDQVYKQRIFMQDAQLKQLQSQINPHFLFNSYFILHRMVVMEDNVNAARFSKQLGTYMQFITRNAEDDTLMKLEVEHARIYTEIQAMRFKNRLTVFFDPLPAKFDNIHVPRLIIQPLIENAFEHGLDNKARDGLLKVSFRESETGLHVVIEDNGSGMGHDELHALTALLDDPAGRGITETTGIINVHRRLQLRYGSNSGLTFSNSELGGLMVKIVIDLQERLEQDNV